ncbi:MAG: hypothetical protein ACLRFH_04055 [Opitutales bacterium]
MDLSLAHLKKVLKFGLFTLFFSINLSVKAYVPAQLEGKYAIKENDTLWGTDWFSSFPNRNLTCTPSAMVDEAGVLWTASFEYMQDHKGLGYELDCHERVNGTITSQEHRFYPWTLIPNVTPNCGSDPNLNTGIPEDSNFFQKYIHNILQPCIAQDIENASHVCMFIYCPPTRYMNATCNNPNAEGGSVEGLMYFDFYKDFIKGTYATNLTHETNFYYHTDNRIYAFNQQNLRKSSDMTHVNLETGNYTAWHYRGLVHLNFIATNESDGTCHAVYHQYNSRWSDRNSITTRTTHATHTTIKTYPRYIKFGDHVYGMIADSCFNGIYITKQGIEDSDYTTIQNWAYPFNNITHYSIWAVAHNYDFCIAKAKDGTGVVCVLGLRPTCASSADKTELSAAYNKAWNNTYTNWNSSNISDPICLMLSSCRMDKTPSDKTGTFSVNKYPELCYESPQNIIYCTGKTSFSQACDLYCSCRTDDYEYHDTQLYKNTHKCCVYTAPSGNQYIIYAYCYPGKTKKCYLGYAQCIVDSNYKVQLLTKTEFSKEIYNEKGERTDIESIGEMNTCEYIVSLDCKGPAGNENVWLTWRYGDSHYYLFHIAAKDLVGE